MSDERQQQPDEPQARDSRSSDLEKYTLIEAACEFWFNDNEQVRSPFPEGVRADAKQGAQAEYLKWVENLTEKDRGEVTDEELASVFETFLFGEGLKLIGTKDPELVLDLQHPFMPRLGDVVNDAKRGPSKVVKRKLEQKDDEKVYMIVSLETVESSEAWEAEFLIPA